MTVWPRCYCAGSHVLTEDGRCPNCRTLYPHLAHDRGELKTERGLMCRYCGQPYPGSTASFEENPFCSACLNERIRFASKDACNETTRVGDYLVFCDHRKGHDGKHANAFAGRTWISAPTPRGGDRG